MILYLDTSSAVKIYFLGANVPEPGAEAVQGLVEEAEKIMTSQITYVEVMSALARAWRGKRFETEEDYHMAAINFRQDWPHYEKVAVTTRLVVEAGALAQKHVLRAYDAVHLASALALKQRIPTDFRFSSDDTRLKRAAQGEGFALA